MIDEAFKQAAQTSPMGSEDADIQWIENEGKIIEPTCYQEVSEFNFDILRTSKMRAFHTIAVPAKKSGKMFHKRVHRAYLMPRPIDDFDVPPPAQRECIFPCRFRNAKKPVFLDNCVENAGFWDNLSGKVHTRNALYVDKVLPWITDAVPLRQKRRREPTLDTPTSPAVDLALVLDLESMTLASTRFLRILDMTDPVIKDVRQDRRKALFTSITRLPTIDEESEPGTPGLVRDTSRATRRLQRRWSPTRYRSSPIRRSTKPARVSPSPERSPAKRIDDTPIPSTPARVLFSKTEDHLSPSKHASPAPAETPLRVFSTKKPEPITPATGDAQSQESSHIQRSRRRSQRRLSLASQAKLSAIDENGATVDWASVFEGSDIDKATVDTDLKNPTIEITLLDTDQEHPVAKRSAADADLEHPVVDVTTADADPKHPVVEEITADADLEHPVVEEIPVDADLEHPVVEESTADADLEHPVVEESTADADAKHLVVEETTADADLEHPVAKMTTVDAGLENPVGADSNNPIVEETIADAEGTGPSAIGNTNVDADSDDCVAEMSIFYSDLEEPVVDQTNMEARLEDSVLEQTKGQTLRTMDVYFGPKSERQLSDASRAPSISECSVDAREQLDIFSQPITAVRSLAGVATGVETAISDSRVIVEKIDGKLLVRFKLPATYADVFSSHYPSTSTAAVHGDLDSPHDETDAVDITHLSTNTDELVAGLPATPTHIVLGGSPIARDESDVLPSYFIRPSSPTRPSSPIRPSTPVGNITHLSPNRVDDQAPSSPPKSQTTPATLDSLLDSPFAPSCAGTPQRPTLASPSRALEHNVPSEPKEMSGGAEASPQSDLADDHEAANRAYLGKFVSEHKASKAARNTIEGSSLPPQATGTGSPKPRTPLGYIDANTASPMKAGAKRRADDDEEAESAKPPVKRGRKSASGPKAGLAPLRRSSRVRARTQETPAETSSRIPVRVGSTVFDGPAVAGETMGADLASVTRANTRRNKGKSVPPAQVLAQQRQDPAPRRMRELKEVHDARAARAGKGAKKGVQWGENSKVIYDPEEDDDDEGAEKAGGAGARQKKKTAKTRPTTPIKRQTRASAKRDREASRGL